MSDSTPHKLEALADFVQQLEIPSPSPPAPGDEHKWVEIDRQIGGQVADRRALVVGHEVAEDARALAARGAAYVLGCVPPEVGENTSDSLADDDPAVEMRTRRWQELDPDSEGLFDLVLCNELLHRVTEPLALLRTLRSMSADNGTLLISSVMLDDPERSEYLRFVPDRFAGDPSWWFVPGRLALRWLLQTAGFETEAEFALREGPLDRFPVLAGYIRATAR